jgi:hypothetical protein
MPGRCGFCLAAKRTGRLSFETLARIMIPSRKNFRWARRFFVMLPS